MAFQLLHKTAYGLYFICNQGAIAEVHCVNQERPEVKCDGRCHLKKYLTQESAEEGQEEEPVDQNWQNPEELPLQFCEALEALDLSYYIYSVQEIEQIQGAIHYLHFDYQASVFHPPIA